MSSAGGAIGAGTLGLGGKYRLLRDVGKALQRINDAVFGSHAIHQRSVVGPLRGAGEAAFAAERMGGG